LRISGNAVRFKAHDASGFMERLINVRSLQSRDLNCSRGYPAVAGKFNILLQGSGKKKFV